MSQPPTTELIRSLLASSARAWRGTQVIRPAKSPVRPLRVFDRENDPDCRLLRELLTAEDITFGYGGRAPILDRPGLGITVLPEVLERLSIKRHTEKWS